MKLMKLYVAGPMRGKPDHGFPAFFLAARQLRALGHEPVLPIEEGDIDEWDNPTKPYSNYMKRDIRMLTECDGIVLLPGWDDSIGATFEARCALEFAIDAYWLRRFGPDEDAVRLEKIPYMESLRGAV